MFTLAEAELAAPCVCVVDVACPRVTDEEEEEEEEEEPEPEPEEEEEPDEPLPLLSSVEEDASKGLKSLWTFRCYPSAAAPGPHATVLARSVLWPGAVAASRKKLAFTLYVGDGQKYLPLGFTPQAPPKVSDEFVAQYSIEDEEPNPLAEQSDPLPPADQPEAGEEDEEDASGEEEEEEPEEDQEDGGD